MIKDTNINENIGFQARSLINRKSLTILLYKIEWFIDFSATNNIDNLTCVIIHDNLTCVDHHETH